MNRPRLTLTFDNGPTPGITDLVLDALAAADVRATFFLVGRQLEEPRGFALARRAINEGHRLGNHTYSHGAPLGLQTDRGAASEEILKTHRLLGSMAGEEPLFRPNGRGTIGPHVLSREAVDVLEILGATVVLWTSVPKDRAVVVDRPEAWVDDAKSAVQSTEHSVIVLHDRPSGFAAPGPMAYLPGFLEWAKASCEIVQTFPDMCVPIRKGRAQPALASVLTDHLNDPGSRRKQD